MTGNEAIEILELELSAIRSAAEDAATDAADTRRAVRSVLQARSKHLHEKADALQLALDALRKAIAPPKPPTAYEQWARACAQHLYGSDEVEFDDEPVVSEGDGGAFVQAWVWVSEDEA